MIIANAARLHAPAIANILSGWIAATPWMPRVHTRGSEKGFAQTLVDRGWTSVACENERVLGFLSRDEAEIHALYLAPVARGKGIGKALLDGKGRSRGPWTLYLSSE
ncbi:GNAT family N-acetyltransferase [Aliiroseovarius sp. 2305UL8-7]|uniref:GNAT family N-acetyltransferase n=1 Tax=Aliiroseovarius conchicola TaxID=3121637 RepID=UPI0035297EFE